MGIDNLVKMGYTLIESKEVAEYLPNTKSLIKSLQTQWLPEDSPKMYIAGGFVRDVYSQMVVSKEIFKGFKDIDFFIPDCPKTVPKIEGWDDLDIRDQCSPFFDALENMGWVEKGDENYPQNNSSNGVMVVYGNTLGKMAAPIDLVFRTEKTMHEVLQSFDYDAVKGIIDPETLNMYVSPEMKNFFEEKDISMAPPRALSFRQKLLISGHGWTEKRKTLSVNSVRHMNLKVGDILKLGKFEYTVV